MGNGEKIAIIIDKNIFPQEICAPMCGAVGKANCGNSQLVANYMGVAGVRTVITLNEIIENGS